MDPATHDEAPVPSSRRQADWFHTLAGRPVVLGLILFVASLALYNSVGKYPFTNYDDSRYLSDNVHVKNGLSWESVKWAFTSYDESNWHPVTWLSHMLDCQLFKLDPSGHHYMNVVFHAMNVVLLFWVLRRSTGYVGRSFMVAAIFAVHPVNVESVVWVSERKNLLSMCFFLLALGAYRWYASKPRLSRYAVVAGLFALGLMAKAQVVTLPFVLLLWDYWPLPRMDVAANQSTGVRAMGSLETSSLETGTPDKKSVSWLVLEKLPLLGMSLVNAVLTMRAQRAAGAITSFTKSPLPVRLENAVVSYARYMGKAVWPSHLSLMYPYSPGSLKLWQVTLASLLLLATTAVVVAKKKPYCIVGWFWFLGTLIPMIGLVQIGVQAMADRYAYLSFVGLFLAICWSVADFAERRHLSKALPAICVVVLAGLAMAAHRQIGYWQSDLALWSHAVAVTTDNYVAEDGIGNSLMEQGDLEGAIPHYRKAAAIRPTDPLSNINIAFYQLNHGDLPGALEQYKKAIEFTQDERLRAGVFINMASIYEQLGNLPDARKSFQAAVDLRPRNERAWIGLGVAAQESGDLNAAVQAYSRAVTIVPTDVGYLLLAGALRQSGRTGEAASATQKAKQLSENMDQTQQFVDGLLAHPR
jgi:Flp pilus assembly protein TadD